jgi:hypothetical protein
VEVGQAADVALAHGRYADPPFGAVFQRPAVVLLAECPAALARGEPADGHAVPVIFPSGLAGVALAAAGVVEGLSALGLRAPCPGAHCAAFRAASALRAIAFRLAGSSHGHPAQVHWTRQEHMRSVSGSCAVQAGQTSTMIPGPLAPAVR